jgi:hypothetical protein
MALKAPSKSSLQQSEPPPPPAQAERVRPNNYDELVRGSTATSTAESPEQVKAKRLQVGEQIAGSLATTELSKTVTIPAGVSDQEAILSLNTLFSSKHPGLNTGGANSRTGAINEKFLGYFLDAAGKSAASVDTSKPRTYTIAFYNDGDYVLDYRAKGTHIRFSGDLSRADQEKQLGTIGLKMAPVEQAAIVFAAEACKDPAKNDFGLRGRVDGLRVSGVSLVDHGKGLEVVKGDDRGDSGNPSNILVTKP